MSIANPTSVLSLERQVTGTNSNTWGTRENANWARLDQASTTLNLDVTAGAVTLTASDSGDTAADAQTRYGRINATGTPAAAATVTWPAAVQKAYYLTNSTTKSVTFKVNGQTGVTLLPGMSREAVCTSVDLVEANTLAYSFADPGYQRIPSGLVMHFGSGTTSGGGTASVPYAFGLSTACLSWGATVAGSGFNALTLTSLADQAGITVYSSSAGAAVGGVGFRWFAIGY